MIDCIRTNAENKDFQKLVAELDADLSIRDGDDHSFYNQFNKIAAIKYVIVGYQNDKPVACGAIKEYDAGIMEVKRMYVTEDNRNRGIASIILNELEQWAIELNCIKCRLETGKNQPEAIALYRKNKYEIIQNFGQYKGVENSVCFEKVLQKK
jgi:putative acetyltransferase